jgi:uncharacterized membrane protein
MTRRVSALLILSALFLLLAMPVAAQEEATEEASYPPLPTAIPSADGSVVQGVFYFSPTCGHCEYVITDVLPGLFADNGGEYVITYDQTLTAQPSYYLMSNGQLQLLMVDTSQTDGNAMFQADSVRLDIDQAGVPRLDFDDTYLVGSGDIPDQFPGIVEEGLAGDGIGWPEVPTIDDALAPFIAEGSTTAPGAMDAETTVEESTDEDETEDEAGLAVLPLGGGDEGLLDKVTRDPLGNGVAIVVLILLVVSLVAVPLLAVRGSLPAFPGWIVLPIALIGIGVAAYLANIEATGNAAVCGPVGDCNAVQESEYAQLFGVPIGVLGVIGYLFIGGLWIVSRVTSGSVSDLAQVLIAAGAFGGVLFSTYLTFLEPFVIGATCLWCITSAVLMMVLLWVTAGAGWSALGRLRGGGSTSSHVTASA